MNWLNPFDNDDNSNNDLMPDFLNNDDNTDDQYSQYDQYDQNNVDELPGFDFRDDNERNEFYDQQDEAYQNAEQFAANNQPLPALTNYDSDDDMSVDSEDDNMNFQFGKRLRTSPRHSSTYSTLSKRNPYRQLDEYHISKRHSPKLKPIKQFFMNDSDEEYYDSE